MKSTASFCLSRSPFAGALLLVVGLFGCASPEVPPATEVELDMASRQILREAVYVNTILDNCARFSRELGEQAGLLRQTWQDKNGDYLAAADAHFTERLADDTVQYRGAPLALSAIQLSHRHQTRAHEELRLDQRSPNNQRIVCERRLNTMESSLQRITPNQGQRSTLVLDTLLSSHPQAGETLATVPTLGVHIARNQEPGRSYYQLLEQEQGECPTPELRVIDNQWPHEAYGAYCESIPYAFIKCEWGECTRR
ncbi:hypothetical protein [Marinimicrobium sp. ABcell2]|uniref:hypothetical protein n=1 Tax=Marinimicrobium sp. ABcell2 TaxID=3069751 RepID=UPI0027B53F0C|nr:hypothetical protein [Marinimicrobium sp. ABcell2]MDQ2078017.1 hypothetical protein [Marinimicrobium sp. ABcell2]